MKKLKNPKAMTVKKVRCLHCNRRTLPSGLFNGSFCMSCMDSRNYMNGSHLRGIRSCVIPGCGNRTDEGCFVGDFCAPCHNYIVGKSCGSERNPSQAYRNELVKANFRVLSNIKTGRCVYPTAGCVYPSTTHNDELIAALLPSPVRMVYLKQPQMNREKKYMNSLYSTMGNSKVRK